MATTDKSWKLKESIAEECQGFIVTAFGKLRHGRAIFLTLQSNCQGAWLKSLTEEFPATPAIQLKGGAKENRAISVALTWSGLKVMGLAESTLASFSTPFREGMFEVNRMRRLGDKRGGHWQESVIEGGPKWSGNSHYERGDEPITAYSVELPSDEKAHEAVPEKAAETALTVHALVMLYTDTEAAAKQAEDQITKLLAPHKAEVTHVLPLQLDHTEGQHGKEHFGWADGVSQPKPYDVDGGVLFNGKPVTEADRINGAPLGEFVIGYENGHQEIAPGPVVPGPPAKAKTNIPEEAGLPPHPDALGFYDIGKNGSYLVVRELFQDVAAFWKSMDEAASHINAGDPKASHITKEWLAEKVVGRTREGHILRPDGPQKPGPDGKPDNNFRYFDDDRFGDGCPLGSHVRRANPRDSLAPKDSMKETLLNAANNHRILRRGRNYGEKLKDTSKDDGADRGLLFMCLNTDIARQFEFVQQTWLLNKDFSTLFEEVDPLVGPDGWMTLPEDPLRRRVPVKTFVQLMGGEYFFLPSLAGLRYLAMQ